MPAPPEPERTGLRATWDWEAVRKPWRALSPFAGRNEPEPAIALAWLFTAATLLDLSNALAGGIRHDMIGEVHDVPWLILCFYVPALWITLALIVWQLVSRCGESIA